MRMAWNKTTWCNWFFWLVLFCILLIMVMVETARDQGPEFPFLVLTLLLLTGLTEWTSYFPTGLQLAPTRLKVLERLISKDLLALKFNNSLWLHAYHFPTYPGQWVSLFHNPGRQRLLDFLKKVSGFRLSYEEVLIKGLWCADSLGSRAKASGNVYLTILTRYQSLSFPSLHLLKGISAQAAG